VADHFPQADFSDIIIGWLNTAALVKIQYKPPPGGESASRRQDLGTFLRQWCQIFLQQRFSRGGEAVH
jgi:hypothetical protein